jgi:HAD superfamily hydrolase (TIGR01549 family)
MPLSQVRAVVFDGFGTLVEIGAPTHPYAQLLQALDLEAAERHRLRRWIMTHDIGLSGVVNATGKSLAPARLDEIERALYRELTSVRCFAETRAVLATLKQRGYRLALASNLAAPYAVPVRLLLPDLDAYVWSFEAGALKPQPAIYAAAAQAVGCAPADILMVGDSLKNDVEGALTAGFAALHLRRTATAAPRGSDDSSDAITDLTQLLPRLPSVASRPG